MDLSCETVRYPEDLRPTSCKFVELHVLCVPDEQWDVKLNKVPAEAIERFISAGFIRVYPDVTLKTLRGEMGALLGAERKMDKFSFLKCVGRSLALVKTKQESDLKVKTFAPPYAPQPELYLLPTVENDTSVCSQSLISETSSSSPDHQNYYHPPKTRSMPAGTKEAIKFPLIPRCSHQPPPTQSLEEEEEEGEEEEEEEEEGEEGEEQSFSSSGTEGETRGECLSSNNFKWAEQDCCKRQHQSLRAPQSVSLNKALQQREARSPHARESLENEGERKRIQQQRQKRAPGDSEETASSDDRDSDFSLSGRFGIIKDAPGSIKTKPATEVKERVAPPSRPLRCAHPSSAPPSAAIAEKPPASPVCPKNREELMEEIKLVRAERKQLERTRQELLRKGKDLLSQNRHRRNQARDSWKKKYFETKKATAPLEEKLRGLQQQLETFYNKLLQQLQARDNRGRQRRNGRSSVKNELIIQILTETHEIETLKRKIEDAKMKLITEMRLRKQAATELGALKAELAQKKNHTQPL